MRRAAVAAVALAVVALCATGCSSSPEQVAASMTSPPRPEARSELAPDPAVPSDPDDPSDSFGDLPEGFEDFGDGVDDMLDQFESELGVAGRCFDLLTKYASLLGSVFGALPGGSDRETVVDDLRAALPSDLHDELQTISDGLESVERDGFAGAGALTDPAFIDANDAIVGWLQSSCGAPSTPGEGS